MRLHASKYCTHPQTFANIIDVFAKACQVLFLHPIVWLDKHYWSPSTMSAAVLTHCAKISCSLHIIAIVWDRRDKEPRMNKVCSNFVYKHLRSMGRSSKQASKGGLLRTISSKKLPTLIYRNLTNFLAQHTSLSIDSTGHVNVSMLLICDPLVPRVFTTTLQLDSNLLVTLEGALIVPLTYLAFYFLCTHH